MLIRSYKVKDLFVVYYYGIKNQDNEISKLREKQQKTYVIANTFLSPNYGKLSINLKMLLAFGNVLKCIIAYSRQAVCIFASSLLGRPNSNDFKKNLFILNHRNVI
jgi:hypothetical protein